MQKLIVSRNAWAVRFFNRFVSKTLKGFPVDPWVSICSLIGLLRQEMCKESVFWLKKKQVLGNFLTVGSLSAVIYNHLQTMGKISTSSIWFTQLWGTAWWLTIYNFTTLKLKTFRFSTLCVGTESFEGFSPMSENFSTVLVLTKKRPPLYSYRYLGYKEEGRLTEEVRKKLGNKKIGREK